MHVIIWILNNGTQFFCSVIKVTFWFELVSWEVNSACESRLLWSDADDEAMWKKVEEKKLFDESNKKTGLEQSKSCNL